MSTLSPALKQEVTDFSKKLMEEFQTFFDAKIAYAKENDQTHEDMVKVLKEYMLREGKHVRPFLTWIAFSLAGGTHKDTKIIRACCAVETLHYYLLNLDDMADRDTVRHGKDTLEVFYTKQFAKQGLAPEQAKHFGRSFSEIAGALLNTYGYELFRTSSDHAERIVEGIDILNRILFEDTSVGWQIHMFQNFQKLHEAQEERFVKGLRLVTAQYSFVAPLMVGIILAGKRSTYEKALVEYGMNVGTGFQIADDILGIFGDPKVTGKAVGNDVREGKKTLLLQYAYTHAHKEDQEFLERVTGTQLTHEELKRVQDIVVSTGSLKRSQQMAQEYSDKGIKALEEITNDSTATYIDMLTQLARYVVDRDH